MTTLANEAADVITGTYGRLTITYRRLTYTWTVTVYAGTLRIDELCATYDNAHAAWHEARRIARAAYEGKTVDQIFAEKPSELALAEAKALIDSINKTMDDAQPKPVDVSDILDDAASTGGWAGYRQSLTTRAAVTSEPMDRILTAAVDGYVPRSKDATSVQLIALARRGLVELHYGRRGNQRVILGARLTGKAAKRVAA